MLICSPTEKTCSSSQQIRMGISMSFSMIPCVSHSSFFCFFDFPPVSLPLFPFHAHPSRERKRKGRESEREKGASQHLTGSIPLTLPPFILRSQIAPWPSPPAPFILQHRSSHPNGLAAASIYVCLIGHRKPSKRHDGVRQRAGAPRAARLADRRGRDVDAPIRDGIPAPVDPAGAAGGVAPAHGRPEPQGLSTAVGVTGASGRRRRRGPQRL